MKVTIAGVRMSYNTLTSLIGAIQERTRKWIEEADMRLLGRLNEKVVETHVRLELERALSLKAGREVRITRRAWNRWREIFAPAWFVREIIDIASFRLRIR